MRRSHLEDWLSVHLFVWQELYAVLVIYVREAAASSFPPPSGFLDLFMRVPHTESQFVYRDVVYLLPAQEFLGPWSLGSFTCVAE